MAKAIINGQTIFGNVALGIPYKFRYSGKDVRQVDAETNPIQLSTVNELDFLDEIFSYENGIFTALVDTTIYYCLKIRSWRPDDRYAEVALVKNGTDITTVRTATSVYTNYIIGSVDILAGDTLKLRYTRAMYGYASVSFSDSQFKLDKTVYSYS